MRGGKIIVRVSCRGWVASEDIDKKTVRREPLMVIPYGLGYFARDALAALNQILQDSNFKQSIQVLSLHNSRGSLGHHAFDPRGVNLNVLMQSAWIWRVQTWGRGLWQPFTAPCFSAGKVLEND